MQTSILFILTTLLASQALAKPAPAPVAAPVANPVQELDPRQSPGKSNCVEAPECGPGNRGAACTETCDVDGAGRVTEKGTCTNTAFGDACI
nr:uncharacterized protein CTRU02_01625 [Colletotrichum truncatum]KAF6799946.1 hypothetical protein CTRU02_01625 [Colletotrichum truncatum]